VIKTNSKIYCRLLVILPVALGVISLLHARTLEDIQLKPTNKIGFYIGSFDPLHKGHEIIIEKALQTYCDYIVVLADNFYNSKKPHRKIYQIRQKMLQALYDEHPKILLTYKNQNELLGYLQAAQVTIVGILGSDSAHETAVSDFIAHRLIIILRKAYEEDISGMIMLAACPVTIAPFYSIDISSTVIKAKIKNKQLIFEDELNPKML